jgi:alpha-L-rhamnosidase
VASNHLLHVLTNHGRLDLAYRLLLTTSPPGWLYPVTQGATTIWERWDGWTEARGFQDPAMNSFNHCAYGAVGEWLYGTVAGLELDPDLAPNRNAYRRARIHPRPPRIEDFPDGLPIHFVCVALDSVHGRYEVNWEISNGRFTLSVRVPPNCSAMIMLPDGRAHDVAAGWHEFKLAYGAPADAAIPVLSEVTELAS